jgi:transcriptional regulator with XRE-family HTH domain
LKYESPLKNVAYRDLAKSIGSRIAAEAERKGLNLAAVARRAGVSQGNLSRQVKNGESCLQLLALYRVAAALDVPIRCILPPGGWA